MQVEKRRSITFKNSECLWFGTFVWTVSNTLFITVINVFLVVIKADSLQVLAEARRTNLESLLYGNWHVPMRAILYNMIYTITFLAFFRSFESQSITICLLLEDVASIIHYLYHPKAWKKFSGSLTPDMIRFHPYDEVCKVTVLQYSVYFSLYWNCTITL